MSNPWPALWTVLALAALLLLIIRYKLNAFVALLVVSLALGLAAGLPPEKTAESFGKGVGDILAGVAILLALGAMLGRMLDASGAAEVIARTLVRAFGATRAPLAILAASYLIGIPVLFNVGFLLLIPIMWRLQRETGESLLWYVLPLALSLGITHSLVPPHPGIVGAVNTLAGDARASVMIETIVFGTLMGVPLVLVGWLGPGRWWASRQHVTVPEQLAASFPTTAQESTAAPPSFALAVLIVTLPLLLSVLGFGARLLGDLGRLPGWMTSPPFQRDALPGWLAVLGHAPVDWVRFLGHPTISLLLPTALAFVLLGLRRGLTTERLARVAGDALRDVGDMVFLFGAAGGFKQVIQDTGAGDLIATRVLSLPLSPVAVAYLVAVLIRIAMGSATASILMASALLAGLARSLPGQETLLVLAVANGVTFLTQPADSGFWMMKEYCNLSVRDVMFKLNACRITMSLTGLALLLAYEAWRG